MINNRIIKIIKWIFIFLVVVIALSGFILYKEDLPLDHLEDKYTNVYSQFINVKGLRTHYRIEGQGPYLVLLHGTGASLHTWDRWTEILKQYFTVVRLDLPAFGLTGPNPQRDYSLNYYNDFIIQFMNQLEIQSFSLAGNSLGGGIAWYFSLYHQERVNQLILIDPTGVPQAKMPNIIAFAQNPFTAFILKHTTLRNVVRDSLEQVYFQDEKITESLVERYWELSLRRGNRQAFIDRANTAYQYPIDQLTEIKIPTLILWGKQDVWIPVSDEKIFSQNIPNSQSIIYPNAGHIPMEEIPDRTAQDALNFLLKN